MKYALYSIIPLGEITVVHVTVYRKYVTVYRKYVTVYRKYVDNSLNTFMSKTDIF